MSSSSTFSRGKLAKLADVKAETIRYYEKCDLIDEPPRSTGGHRIYSEEHLRRLTFIRRCRELGFSISEIRGLLRLANGAEASCQEVRQATQAHLVDVREKINDLRKMEGTLEDMVKQCESNTAPACPVIEALFT
ncbi:MAG: transcriptional regulator [Cellvibrionaceae bacterium]|jgi:MerR family transcriptional regulator, mercuric resistance operon regulatory protein|nr:transcriptional regulator [Cellvibrionaceae bacterium]